MSVVTRRGGVILTLACALALPASASAHQHQAPFHYNRGWCVSAKHLRTKVIRRYGQRAPGRDICKWGVIRHHGSHKGKIRMSSSPERRKYVAQLRVILHPRPYTYNRTVGQPAQQPAGTLTPVAAPTGIAACIVQRESGGRTDASNGTHFGIAQWAYSTWRAQGGVAMTGVTDPRDATYQQQLQVLSHALATEGSGAWSPYDGC